MTFDVVLPGPWRTLVVRPREDTFGHQVLELLMGHFLAERLGCRPAMAWPARTANAALAELRSREIPMREGPVAALARAVAGRRARRRRAAATRKAPPPDFAGLDFRACYARRVLGFALRPRAAAEADRLARECGVAPDGKLAILHVRESGFKAAGGGESAADAARNARIETYLPAVDLLVERGFTVVRVGDRTMTPVSRRGVVDVATWPRRTDALELGLALRGALMVAGDSGPYVLSYLTGMPCLAVNVTNVLGAYPLRRRDRYLPKHVRDARTGRELRPDDLLTEEYFQNRKDPARYEVRDNTADEIRAGVSEVLEAIDGEPAPSAGQRRFRERADALFNGPLVARKRTAKGEPAQQLLGEGYICRAAAEAGW